MAPPAAPCLKGIAPISPPAHDDGKTAAESGDNILLIGETRFQQKKQYAKRRIVSPTRTKASAPRNKPRLTPAEKQVPFRKSLIFRH